MDGYLTKEKILKEESVIALFNSLDKNKGIANVIWPLAMINITHDIFSNQVSG